MRRTHKAATLVFAAALAGCDSSHSLTANPGPPPPHGGKIMPLKGDQGFVEIVQKRASRPKDIMEEELAFYFYKDAYTPISPTPASGTLVVGRKKITLKPSGEALVTPTGPGFWL